MLSLAQTVYETKDKAGPVFSDRPSPGASAVQLQAPNVVDAPPAPKPPAAASASAAPAPYKRFVIERPAEQDMVHTNTGAFAISASLSPPLRPSDRVRVLLDGNLVPTIFRSTDIRLSEADWQDAAVSLNGEHTLQLAVVDADGKPAIETAPVRFYARGAAVGGGRRR
jgi:hypothetical protein